MLNANTSRPSLEPTDGIPEVIHYLRKRDAALQAAAERESFTTYEKARARAALGEVRSMLMALDPTFNPLAPEENPENETRR